MGEIDEHSVGFVDSHHFNLRFVLKLVPLARLETVDSAQTKSRVSNFQSEMKERIRRRKRRREPFEKIQKSVLHRNGFLVHHEPTTERFHCRLFCFLCFLLRTPNPKHFRFRNLNSLVPLLTNGCVLWREINDGEQHLPAKTSP